MSLTSLLRDDAVGTLSRTASDLLQQNHYNEIASDYETHYSDSWSLEYRRRFMYEPMFEGIDLKGARVLDAMCGSGQTTEFLLKRGANVTGLDISEQVLTSFRRQWPECTAVQRSLLDSGLPSNLFDCVAIVGGLHHVHPNVSRAIAEIYRVLKPGGYFCFMEPHDRSLPNIVRRIWYQHDRYFSANEAAIDLHTLGKEFAGQFTAKNTRFLGNVAFLLVLNSLIFRIPLRAKRYYAPVLFPVEALVMRLQTQLTSCFAISQWQKR
ncbi:MAG TPA: class I SAM-dependent methyltransferase [Pyrinomonadaceae bacterium]|nr:class I SAM-dependent methyltransferase [Pyrinomonadaceae bacterium]